MRAVFERHRALPIPGLAASRRGSTGTEPSRLSGWLRWTNALPSRRSSIGDAALRQSLGSARRHWPKRWPYSESTFTRDVERPKAQMIPTTGASSHEGAAASARTPLATEAASASAAASACVDISGDGARTGWLVQNPCARDPCAVRPRARARPASNIRRVRDSIAPHPRSDAVPGHAAGDRTRRERGDPLGQARSTRRSSSMLSGIGLRAAPRMLGIPSSSTRRTSAENLQDRYEVSVVNRMPFEAWRRARGRQASRRDDPAYREWHDKRKGALTRRTGRCCPASLRSQSPAAPVPDPVPTGLLTDFRGYEPGYTKRLPAALTTALSWVVLKARTRIRGDTVTLASRDPARPAGHQLPLFRGRQKRRERRGFPPSRRRRR